MGGQNIYFCSLNRVRDREKKSEVGAMGRRVMVEVKISERLIHVIHPDRAESQIWVGQALLFADLPGGIVVWENEEEETSI